MNTSKPWLPAEIGVARSQLLKVFKENRLLYRFWKLNKQHGIKF